MTLHFFRSMALWIVAAGVFALPTGCASSPDAKSTVGSMSTFGVETAKVKDSIDGSVKSLEVVVGSQPGDIKSNFDAYAKSVKALDRQAKVVRERANEMKVMGDEFFKGWEPPASVSPERRAELTASYAKIKEDMTLAKEDFAPFLNSLKDIESYLRLDLSLKGIHSTADLVKKAKDDGARVKSRIDAVLSQLNSVRGMLSTKP
jgi:Protein of unknown function (DUF2959)